VNSGIYRSRVPNSWMHRPHSFQGTISKKSRMILGMS
jgi:hypothetical protein